MNWYNRIIKSSVDKVIPYSDRTPEEKKKIKDFDKKMTTDSWKEEYDEGTDRHWMDGATPCPLAKEVVKELDDINISTAEILEIGIGNGRDSIFMAKKGHNVIGIDISPEPVSIAKEKAKKGKVENVKFETGDAENLKYEPDTFDVVYSVAAIHSTPLQSVLKEIYRVLKPGGIAKLFLYTKMKSGATTTHYWSPAQIKSIAKKTKFKIKKFREGRQYDTLTIPGVKGKVKQESRSVITTLQKSKV